MVAGGPKRVTLKDVAKEAGVSVGMASRVLAGYGSFSEETATRVLNAARRLDYRPNMLARSLRLGRTRTIGFVISYLIAPHWTPFARDVDAAASERGYQVLVGTAANDPKSEERYLRTLQEHFVTGIIATPSPANERVVAELLESGLPMVLLGSNSHGLKAPKISLTDRDGARMATEHLLGLGHRRIAMVGFAPSFWAARERIDGYLDALKDGGVDDDGELLRVDNHGASDAYAATEDLLDLADPPTALLAANEPTLGAVLHCLKDRKVRVPDDLSVVTFDDPAWASFYRPAITTLPVPRVRLAEMAVELLLAQVTPGEDGPPGHDVRFVELDLVVRESTAPPLRA